MKKKKLVSSASTDDLQHQKLKLYLHFTKKILEVIRINFVEIPWLASLLTLKLLGPAAGVCASLTVTVA